MYYDNRGRAVQTTRYNPMGSWDKTNIGYSYTGEPLLSRTVRYNGTKAFAERYSYTYDTWDRPLTVTHALSSLVSLQTGEYTYGTSSQLHDYQYDHAGRMVLDNRNGSNALKTRFVYNVRSWAEEIACGKHAIYSDYGNVFREIIRYQNPHPSLQNTPQWGGNISSMDWKCGNDNVTRTYTFTYDDLSRLKTAAYRDSQNNVGTYGRSYSYDRHGNVLSVASPSGTVSASYSGNRRSGSGYTYDSNGNMTADPDANLSGMTYNVLNLLSGYTNGANGYQTTFEYTASGEKMREVSKNGNVISAEKHYVGNVVYEGLMGPSRLLIDGGYVEITSTFSSMSYAYRFNVQDHQGNNRMVMDAIGTELQVNHYDPYGQLLTAISSTPAVSQYKYGGKEWSPTSLSYDFGARNYLPSVPRWNSMDPLAEKYYSISPYVYCAGNPVNLVDRDGKSTKVKRNEDGTYEVIGGDLSDGDLNIYVYQEDDEGNYIPTGVSIGKTTSLTSFYNADADGGKGEWAILSRIDLNDKSGKDFITHIVDANEPLVIYAIKALPGGMNDFKTSNGTRDKSDNNRDIYRGMPLGSSSNGVLYISSARDIGNMAAGYEAGIHGLSWLATRILFDGLQSITDQKLSFEKQSSVNAEYYGWNNGHKKYERKNKR